ncbi:MAG: hypothetical protein Q9164_006338, partial [Protoblastenia rupestris]
MLSALRFRVKPPMNIYDVSTPGARLWDAVLEYLRTFPGYEKFYWGRTLEDSDLVEIELLLPFESLAWWQKFQKSLGTCLAVGIFADAPAYRSIRLAPHDLGGNGRITRIKTYRFPETATETDKNNFERAWSETESILRELDFVSQGGWVEFETPHEDVPQDLASLSKSTFETFVVCSWRDEFRSNAAHRADGLIKDVADQVNLSVESRSVSLQAELGAKIPKELASPPLEPCSLAALIMRQLPRQSSYTEAAGTPSSISKPISWPNKAPMGGRWPMGDIALQYRKKLPGQSSIANSSLNVLDVVEMVFPSEIAETFKLSDKGSRKGTTCSHPDAEPGCHPTVTAFKIWRRQVLDFTGSEVLYWDWANKEVRTASQPSFYESFSTIGKSLTRSIRIYNLPNQPEYYHNPSVDYAEIVLFHTVASDYNRSLFEEYFTKFYLITHYSLSVVEKHIHRFLSQDGKFPQPGTWVEKTEVATIQATNDNSNSLSVQRVTASDTYIGFFMWKIGEKGEAQWLQDYLTSSYDTMGWLADGLRAVTTLGAESFK